MALAADGDILVLVNNFSSPNYSLILLKINPALTTISWQRKYSNGNQIYGAKLLVDGSDIYIIADAYATSPSSICFIKYDDTGAFQFSRCWNGIDGFFTSNSNNINGKGAALLGSNIYVRAITSHTVGTSDQNRGSDINIFKFDLTGEFVWGANISGGGENPDVCQGISTDGSDIYLAGIFDGGDTNNGFLVKSSEAGIKPGVYGGHYTVRDWPLTEQTVTPTETAASLTALSDPAFTDAAGTYTVSSNSGLDNWLTPLGEAS
jgi:hypothetical protein